MQTCTRALLFFCLLLALPALAQQPVPDSIFSTKLDEVVVTGQIEPQSVKKAIRNVRVITRQDIQRLAANNLGELLTQYINITVKPSNTDGRSTVSMFGLDALYFKILIDNVPLVNEAGMGNNIDLSQINLNDVERIEIIEGSMGVTHGANAVSGILNIITKKSSQYAWGAIATLQEESVGNEYSTFAKGRHIQALQLSHTFNSRWYATANVNRNDFQGYLGNKKGKFHDTNDSLRGYSWLPKEQLMANALVSYNSAKARVFYRFEYLDENMDYYNSTVESGYSPTLGAYRFSADKRYITNRFYHHLNASGKVLSTLNYNVSLSHQRQARDAENFFYRINQQQEYNNTRATNQSMEVLYSTGTLSNFFPNSRVNLQVGYEAVNNNGFSLIQEADNVITGVRKHIENYDAFTAADVRVTNKLSVSPGIRYSVQSRFDNQYAASLGARQQLPDNMELRAAVNKGYRTPTFDELYNQLIFSGHYFTGNPDLIPETSTSFEASLRKTTTFSHGIMLSGNLVGSYMDVKDRISTAFTGYTADNVPKYVAINVDKYHMWNLSTTNQLQYRNFNMSLGATVVGISQKIDNGEFVSNDKYLYTLNLNTSASYRFSKWNSVLAAYYKYNGKIQQYVADPASSTYLLSAIPATSWLDASFTKTFYKKLDVQLGARNLLNVTSVNQTNINSGGGSHAPASGVLLAYGRSYYFKLTYNLNF